MIEVDDGGLASRGPCRWRAYTTRDTDTGWKNVYRDVDTGRDIRLVTSARYSLMFPHLRSWSHARHQDRRIHVGNLIRFLALAEHNVHMNGEIRLQLVREPAVERDRFGLLDVIVGDVDVGRRRDGHERLGRQSAIGIRIRGVPDIDASSEAARSPRCVRSCRKNVSVVLLPAASRATVQAVAPRMSQADPNRGPRSCCCSDARPDQSADPESLAACEGDVIVERLVQILVTKAEIDREVGEEAASIRLGRTSESSRRGETEAGGGNEAVKRMGLRRLQSPRRCHERKLSS